MTFESKNINTGYSSALLEENYVAYTTMTSFLILHQMTNEKDVTWENIWAVVPGYYIFFDIN